MLVEWCFPHHVFSHSRVYSTYIRLHMLSSSSNLVKQDVTWKMVPPQDCFRVSSTCHFPLRAPHRFSNTYNSVIQDVIWKIVSPKGSLTELSVWHYPHKIPQVFKPFLLGETRCSWKMVSREEGPTWQRNRGIHTSCVSQTKKCRSQKTLNTRAWEEKRQNLLGRKWESWKKDSA